MASNVSAASDFIEKFSRYIEKNGINIFRVAVSSGDGEVEVRSFKECNPCQDSYSVAKFFTLTAIGLLWDDGLIRLDDKLVDIFGSLCPPNMPSSWNDRTIEMAIRHYTGLPGGYLDIDSQNPLEFGKDYLSYVLSTTLGDSSKYSYTDAEYYLLSRVVGILSRKPMLEYLWERLFLKLDFREVAWSCCPMNHPMGATGLYVRTEDMLKLGILYLNRGVYNGNRILSEDWIDLVTERELLKPVLESCYGHGGMLGQMLAVCPKHKLAIAWHGYTIEGKAVKEWVNEYLRNM